MYKGEGKTNTCVTGVPEEETAEHWYLDSESSMNPK